MMFSNALILPYILFENRICSMSGKLVLRIVVALKNKS